MDKRKEKRIKKRAILQFGETEQSQKGFSADISKHGMQIKSARILQTDKKINIKVNLGDQEVQLQGVVCWNYELSGYSSLPKTMGIFFLNPPQEFMKYVENLKE